jgi:hypothetical protein
VRQEDVPDSFQMYVPMTVDLGGGRQGRFRVKVAGPVSEIVSPLLPSEPKGVKVNELEGVLCELKMERW